MPAAIGGSAKRYAEAIFDIAESHNSFDRWLNDLTAIAEIERDSEVSDALASPAIEMPVKEAVVAKVLPDLSPEAHNLVKLLLRRGKMRLIGQILYHYRVLLNDYRGIATAEVTSAVPLADRELEAVADRLSAITGRKIVVEATVDPSIMGGIVARVGDQLIDASVKGRLEALKKRLGGVSTYGN